MHVGIVGLGAMGQAVARALHQQAAVALVGFPAPVSSRAPVASLTLDTAPRAAETAAATGVRLVAVASRRPAAAASLAAELPGVSVVPLAALLAHADVVLLTVGDRELEATVQRGAWTPRHVVVHLSGALTLDPLAAARDAGAAVGSLHPMVSVPRETTSAHGLFSGAVAAIDGASAVQPVLRELAAALDLQPVEVASEWRAQWHAAATLVGNASTALVSHAEQLLDAVPMDAAMRRRALLGLLQSVVDNMYALPDDRRTDSILTGPIARGDVATVARHLAHLPQSGRAAYHHAASLVLLAAAGHLPESARDALAALLSASTPA